jgi:NADPH2:quinone reductase
MVRLRRPKGKSVLVNAAAGGVGSLLLQLARLEGAVKVVGAVGSAAKRELVTELGADGAVNYREADWVAKAREANGGDGFGVVYESVGGDITKASLGALGFGGEMVIYGALNIATFALGPAELGGLMFGNQSVAGFALNPLLTDDTLQSGLKELFALAANRKIKVASGGAFPFSKAADAHRALEQRATTGKVVLVPDSLA